MLKFRFNYIVFFLILKCSGVVAQATPELVLPEDKHGIVKVKRSSFSSQEEEVLHYDDLAVFVKNDRNTYTSNAIQGKHRIDGNYLTFKPYFPFEYGMNYVVRTSNKKSAKTYTYQSFQIEKERTVEQAAVVAIYPSANQLPENLLRFYIYFNTPMKKGQALKQIQLVDEEGGIDQYAFMEFKQELWSADGKRLTLLFDPGRIKRGLSTNELRGPALLAGKPYELIISGDWKDVYGQPLSISLTKKIEVVSPYHLPITLSNWRINPPRKNSHDKLTLHFDRIIDHALLSSMVTIVDEEENPINGYWEIAAEEQSVLFLPKEKWPQGNYKIIIDSRLEDVAGNNLQNLLDHHTTDKANNNKTHHYIDFKL